MRHYQKIFALLTLSIFFSAAAFAQTTAFTYQGKLTDGSVPASGVYTMRFDLFAGSSGGTALATQSVPAVSVANGIFTVNLNFGGGVFDGSNRYLEITVGSTTLSPRQLITSAPYAIRSLNAGTATDFTGGLSGDVSGTQGATHVDQVAGYPAAAVVEATLAVSSATSSNSPETLVKRDISGDFSANIIDAATQYNIGGNRVLSVTGSANTFAGIAAGSSNTTGQDNSFFGADAGSKNTGSHFNSFFGSFAGFNNTGAGNSFFGNAAGFSNTTGTNNTIIGGTANVGSGALNYATAIGAGATVSDHNTVVLGRTLDTVIAPNLLQVNVLSSPGATRLCRNSINLISTCTTPLAEKSGGENAAALNALREQLKQQRREIDELRQIVCTIKPDAAVCKEINK